MKILLNPDLPRAQAMKLLNNFVSFSLFLLAAAYRAREKCVNSNRTKLVVLELPRGPRTFSSSTDNVVELNQVEAKSVMKSENRKLLLCATIHSSPHSLDVEVLPQKPETGSNFT